MAVSGALAATLLAGSEAVLAAEPKPPAAPESVAASAFAQDLPSARLAAKLRGERVEVLDMRTEASTTWANPDGTMTTETSAGPIRFRRDGQWVDIDVTFARRPDGSVASRAHPGGLRLAGPGGESAKSFAESASSKPQDLITVGTGTQAVTLQWKGGLPEPKLDGAKATYPEALPGADLVVEATRTGFEQYLILNKRPEAGSSFTLPLRAEGVNVAKQADGGVLFTDKATSRELSTMPAPYMWDATVDPNTGEHTRKVPVGLELTQTGSNIELRVTPDETFLADPTTQFPVTVDPSSGTLSDVFDTWVQQGQTADQSTHTELKIGWPGDYANPPTNTQPRIARSFITWNMAPIKNAIVSSATLKLFNFHSWDCTQARAWEVWDTNTSNTSTRWTAQPNWLQKFATSTETRGNNCSNGGWVSADVTSLLQYWAGQTSIVNQGMGIRATNEADTYAWKRFYSGNAAASQIPKIEVTYNYRPRTGTDQQVGPPFFAYNGEYVVNTLTPTLRDTFVDADNDQVNGTFQIFDAATNTQVGNVIVSPYAPSGQPVSAVVPAGVLQNGKTYKFRSSPYDGTHYNDGWSAWKTFTVDTQSPSAPASVTSADYPSGQWVKGVGQAGTFTVAPPAADHHWIEWSLDGATWTKVATNGSAAPVAFSLSTEKGGTNYVHVRSVDKADNKSEPLSYIFHVGAGGITSVDEGASTAARLPLTVEADAAKYTAATFLWRRSDADAWQPIPLANVLDNGQPVASWPLVLAAGKSALLTWNAADTVNPDGTVQIKADLTGPNNATGATDVVNVTVDRNADGAASASIGPGSLNLLTGDYTVTATDASFFEMSVSRTASSRAANSGDAATGQVQVFGPGWQSGVTAETTESGYTEIRQTSGTSLEVIDSGGGALHYSANQASTGWIGEAQAEGALLTGSFATGFVMTEERDGTVTTFGKADPAATTWTVTSSLVAGLTDTTTRTVSETVPGPNGTQLARPKRIIAPTSAVNLATCESAPATRGCRVLEFVYADTTTATGSATATEFGDFAGQVKEIRLWATAPGAAASTATSVAAYRYDLGGSLRQTWDPRISPALITQYTYDTDGRLASLTPPGQLPWTFTYGNAGGPAAGAGMLLKVSRDTLTPGTADQTNGTAATSVVYGVPVTGGGSPYDLGAAKTGEWAQDNAPTDAVAIFPADQVPVYHNGSGLTAGQYSRATVHYLDPSGREVNTADPGGSISAKEFDRFGNTVRELTAGNRLLALSASEADRVKLAQLGIEQLTSRERAVLLSTASVYSADGARELETYGPLQLISLAADLTVGGTVVAPANGLVAARRKSVREFDVGRPTDGSATVRNQITSQSTGAQLRLNPELFADVRVTTTAYDWAKGVPVRTVDDPAGLALTRDTHYDARGRVVKTTQPESNGNDAGATITTYYTGDGSGVCGGRPEWADSVCTVGSAGAITGGGTNPAQLPVKTLEYGVYGQTVKVSDTVAGVTRTTVTQHDSAGRAVVVSVTGGTGTAIENTTTGYHPETGQPVTTASPSGGTITKVFDRLGRQISYTDADGGTTTTRYDSLGRPIEVGDSVPSTTTYTYDTALDPRGLATSMTDSVAGTFTARYDANGAVVKQELPGGYTMRQDWDPMGAPTVRSYSRNSDGLRLFDEAVTRTVHGQEAGRSTAGGVGSTRQYTYDMTGRLVQARQVSETVCTSRSYTFDGNTNRLSKNIATGLPGEQCPTTGGNTETHTYDSADRLVDAGYSYDAFGRTTAQPGGRNTAYYVNDLVRQQWTATARQTWMLDAAQRFRSWTTESLNAGTWTSTGSKLNHFDGDGDSPRWIVENTATGALTRNVVPPAGGLAATTAASGGVVLQLSNMHGDVVVSLDSSGFVQAFDADEYGLVPEGKPGGRYGWLGAHQRSAETPSGNILMGIRLYDPAKGRFLSVDPVQGGNANAYEYTFADPLNRLDLDGRISLCFGWCKKAAKKVVEAAACASLGGYYCGLALYISWEAARRTGTGRVNNAVRHFMWQAAMTFLIGTWAAKRIGDAHEWGESGRDTRIDQANNSFARRYASSAGGWWSIYQAYRRGDFWGFLHRTGHARVRVGHLKT